MKRYKYLLTGLKETAEAMRDMAEEAGAYQIVYYGMESGKVWVRAYRDPSGRTWEPFGWPEDFPVFRTQCRLTEEELGDVLEYTLDHGSVYGCGAAREGKVSDVDIFHGSVTIYTEENVGSADYEKKAEALSGLSLSEYEIEPAVRKLVAEEIAAGKTAFETEEAEELYVQHLIDALLGDW